MSSSNPFSNSEAETYDEKAAEYKAADREMKVELVVGWMDEGRLELRGGYPSHWTIHAGWVFVATLDHDDAPELIAMPIGKFLKEYEWTWNEDY